MPLPETASTTCPVILIPPSGVEVSATTTVSTVVTGNYWRESTSCARNHGLMMMKSRPSLMLIFSVKFSMVYYLKYRNQFDVIDHDGIQQSISIVVCDNKNIYRAIVIGLYILAEITSAI